MSKKINLPQILFQILSQILSRVAKVLSFLSIIVILIMLLVAAWFIIKIFLMSGGAGDIFTEKNIAFIIGVFTLGITAIIGGIGLFRKKEWARKLFMWLLSLYALVILINIGKLYFQGNLTLEQIKRTGYRFFYIIITLFVLTHLKVKEQFK